MKTHWTNILPILVALAIGGYFYFDNDTRLANHVLKSIDYTGTCIVESNGEGRIIGFNKNFEKLTGFTRKELLGMPLVNIMVSQARSKHPREMRGASTAVTIVRCAIQRKDGGIEPVFIQARIGGGLYVASITPENLVIDHYSEKAGREKESEGLR